MLVLLTQVLKGGFRSWHIAKRETMSRATLFAFAIAYVLAALFCIEGAHEVHEEATDVSSPEFKKIASETYKKIAPCLEKAWMYADKNTKVDWKFPDDAQAHFEHILDVTDPFRHVSVHEYAGYEGPWIENMFISKYMSIPLYKFRGVIPIYVQWIDSQILRGRLFNNILNELSKVLRPNVIYMAISQGDVGLGMIGRAHPNILALSAGGYGHVVIPLVKGELEIQPHREEFDNDVAFFGNPRQPPRPNMLPEMEQLSHKLSLKFKLAQGANWLADMNATKFNLAPRGYGRSSFRFAEAIQMGRMPVFLYDDVPWIPFQNTNISATTFGLVGQRSESGQNTLADVMHSIKNMTDVEYRAKLKQLHAVRSHYTYRGVFRQIAMFLQDPFGPDGGHLQCAFHPRSERCCG